MATIGSIISSIKAAKCTDNIEKLKIKLPSNDKFCSFDAITEQDGRHLVKEFGQEICGARNTLKGSDPNYYELSLKTSDPHAQALLRVEADGSFTKFISNLNNQYSIDMYSKQAGRIKNTSNNGVTYEVRENLAGDVLQLSEKKPDKTVFTITKEG